MGRDINKNPNIVIVDGKEMLVQHDYVVSTNRTIEEIDKSIQKLKEESDKLTDWLEA